MAIDGVGVLVLRNVSQVRQSDETQGIMAFGEPLLVPSGSWPQHDSRRNLWTFTGLLGARPGQAMSDMDCAKAVTSLLELELSESGLQGMQLPQTTGP